MIGNDAVADHGANQTRSYLLLQGPASPFFRHVARNLESKGHRVQHIAFCIGDRLFFRQRGSHWFQGRPALWPVFLRGFIDTHAITDLLMLGDGRPVHAEAIAVAQPLGVRIHILEHGYVRPDWLTIEPDGMSGRSRFFRDPHEIALRARQLGDPDFRALYRSSFFVYACYDLIYHLPNVALGWFFHPHYRRHGPVHPLVEYGGWIWKAMTSPWETRHRQAALARAFDGQGALFFCPLQLPGDYQIKVHAPGGDLFKLVDAIIRHFAAHAPAGARLLFKVHPIDNGLSRWHRRIGRAARETGIDARVFVVDGGSLDDMIAASDGVVTVNSTVGLAALMAGKPLIALGNAIFALPGLTHQGSLSAFWQSPAPPDAQSVRDFLKVLVDTIQVRGGFIARQAVLDGARAVADRVAETRDRLPPNTRPAAFVHEAELFPPAE